jgi:hypothetical protein
VDALELLLLLRDRDPTRYTRAALRWHARCCREVPGVTLNEAAALSRCWPRSRKRRTTRHPARLPNCFGGGSSTSRPASSSAGPITGRPV